MNKIIVLTLQEYHEKKYIYFVILLCVAPLIALSVGVEKLGSNPLGAIIEGYSIGILLFCSLAMILIAMKTYSPQLESGAVVLDLTKPVTRKDYFLGKFIVNIVLLCICVFCMSFLSLFLLYINKYTISKDIINQLFNLEAFIGICVVLFVLSVASFLNLYLSAKATGVSSFFFYVIYMNTMNYFSAHNSLTSKIVDRILIIFPLSLVLSLIILGIVFFSKKEV
jgi:ABC-type transport system involved in multi-copper enzyme maturation permease subunit